MGGLNKAGATFVRRGPGLRACSPTFSVVSVGIVWKETGSVEVFEGNGDFDLVVFGSPLKCSETTGGPLFLAS
jgi:hypothetical protein